MCQIPPILPSLSKTFVEIKACHSSSRLDASGFATLRKFDFRLARQSLQPHSLTSPSPISCPTLGFILRISNTSGNARPLGKAAKAYTPLRYVHSDRTTGSSRTPGLAILADIAEVVALPGWLSRLYLGRMTLPNSLVGRGAEASYWQCFSDGDGQEGGKYRWTDIGECSTSRRILNLCRKLADYWDRERSSMSDLKEFSQSTESLINHLVPRWLVGRGCL